MKAAILLPVLADRDAVGNDVLAMAGLLRERGIDTRIFCDQALGVAEPTYPPNKALDFAGGPADLILYEFSVGWPVALDILRRARGYRIVRYQNITPPEFFAGYSAAHVAACERGRAEIPQVARLDCELYLGGSTYNSEELIAAGAPRARSAVLAPFHRIDDLLTIEADLPLLDALGDGARNVLMVGRVAPNKGHLELVDTFAALVDGWGDPARLLIVGKSDPQLKGWTERIRARIDQHRLGARVRWLDSVSPAQLKSAYLASHAFLTMSRHEGFCVPVVEAMALGTPVVAYGSSALPETIGGGGIVWPEPDPWLHAASIARLASDEGFRNELRDAGRRRYQQAYSTHALRARFHQVLEAVS